MIIGSQQNYLGYSQGVNKNSVAQGATAQKGGFASELSIAKDSVNKTSDIKEGPQKSKAPDFSSMTKQQLFDWMNGELEAGRMTLDESSPFLMMTLDLPADGGVADQARSERFNFIELAKIGKESAAQRGATHNVQVIQRAIEIMQSSSKVDLKA